MRKHVATRCSPPSGDVTMLVLHLRGHRQDHQHRVHAMSTNGIEIRQSVRASNAALLVRVQRDW